MAGTSRPARPKRPRTGAAPPAPTHSPSSTHRPAAVAARPSFGVDRPSVVIAFVALAVALTFTGIFVGSPAGLRWSALFWVGAVACALVAGALYVGSVWGKARLWAGVLDGLGLRGDEVALDAGCGRGLVLVALARRLPDGHVTGVDRWRGRDQSGNSRAAAELNAALAGVAGRVTVRDGDVRALGDRDIGVGSGGDTGGGIADGAFDVVTASLVLGRLPTAQDRAVAVHELVRVTRPGGRIVVVDGGAAELSHALADAGAVDVVTSPARWLPYPPVRVITASSPAAPGS